MCHFHSSRPLGSEAHNHGLVEKDQNHILSNNNEAMSAVNGEGIDVSNRFFWRGYKGS